MNAPVPFLGDLPLNACVVKCSQWLDPDLGRVEGMAAFSACETYRYVLGRRWDPTRTVLLWVMLNPSTATHEVLDPTVNRCFDYAKRWGFGGLLVANCFALRSTDPRALKTHADPIGPHNDEALRLLATMADHVMGAWGSHGKLGNRGVAVYDLLQEARQGRMPLQALGHNQDGHPVHPLYQPKELLPIPAQRPLVARQPTPRRRLIEVRHAS